METVVNRVSACMSVSVHVCACPCVRVRRVGVCLFPSVQIECQVLNREIYYFFYSLLMLSHSVDCTTQFAATEQSVLLYSK